MHKLFILFSLFLSSIKANYISVEKIECYSNIGEKIQFNFEFESDYINVHELVVNFEIYDEGNLKVANYTNSIKIVGNKKSIATIDYLYKDRMYVYVTVNNEEEKIVDRVRFDLKGNNKCYLNELMKECNEFYKSTYKKGKLVNEYSDMKVLYLPFNAFLDFNYLDIENILIYSNYDISKDEVYLEIDEKINEYDLVYDENYRFLLGINMINNQYSFYLLEDYYLGLPEFLYTDIYSDKYISTNKLYFPYDEDYKEYLCKLVIHGVIDVEMEFKVSTSDNLFGGCDNSKYCLERVNYD